mmetsp:Transcript_56267/g.117611  ORF Transcript_56267/g.117611 Transcript_56267/m.117611 type:complete len:83 (-) Transcript_56267:65-313(-)|eukprot:CAMPEP_0172182812 /NCGR_PEP_ID=MMETSP1050-20130122/18613_1 /TAXON_ID=233186 /ORGANISM="Cryptomonas curvata, Strain CCAP979/52" /LENGTH=82 /DNA_ID=CAMNT_0012856311 /DNA_START=42 /DNA_END=290 /DNA_ORIENTATION=-
MTRGTQKTPCYVMYHLSSFQNMHEYQVTSETEIFEFVHTSSDDDEEEGAAGGAAPAPAEAPAAGGAESAPVDAAAAAADPAA